MTITEFLAARLDDDEAYARTAYADHNDAEPEWTEPWSGSVQVGPREDPILTFDSGVSRHMVRHDPARVLREVAAKRLIIEMHPAVDGRCEGCGIELEDAAGCLTLRALASTYADHPDYRQKWRP